MFSKYAASDLFAFCAAKKRRLGQRFRAQKKAPPVGGAFFF